MHCFFKSILVLGFLLTVSISHPTQPEVPPKRDQSLTSLLPPSKDPFYTAPHGYEVASPGTVLRVRNAPANLTSVGNCSAAYNIVYRTTDSQYKPAWAVTTLFIPLSKSKKLSNGQASLLSYQIPYDSANVDYSPSFTLYNTPYPDIPAALGRGWYVNVPDFEGPIASFTAGVNSGHATLDSVRAVLSSDFRLPSSTRYAMWGYSGGTFGTEYAAELQVQYAPELNFSGVAIGGVLPNLTTGITQYNGQPFAGLIPLTFVGLSTQFPAAKDFLDKNLHPSGLYNKTTFMSVQKISNADALEIFHNQNISNYFIGGLSDYLPFFQTILNHERQMGYHGVPQMPLYVYKAIQDELSPIAQTDALVERFCGIGVNILYQRNTVGGHFAEAVNGDAAAFEWLIGVLEGTHAETYITSGCTVRNVMVAIDPSST